MKSKKTPGRISFKTMRSGKTYIYYTPYKSKERIATGLEKSKKNIEITEQILETCYLEYLQNGGLLRAKNSIPLLSEAFTNHIQKQKEKLQPNTIKTIQAAFRNIFHQDYTINDTHGKTYRIERDLQQYVTNNTQISNTTKNINLRSISSFLRVLREEYNININVRQYFQKEEKRIVQVYDDSEIQIIRKYLAEHSLKRLYWFDFLMLTGSRLTESIELKWSDVDFERGTISFTNKINRHQKEQMPITDYLRKILLDLYSTRETSENPDKVFGWKKGMARTLRAYIDKIQTDNGIKKDLRSIHALRKTFINKIIDTNVSPYEAHLLFRHRDLKTTMQHYKHQDIEKQKAILENVSLLPEL